METIGKEQNGDTCQYHDMLFSSYAKKKTCILAVFISFLVAGSDLHRYVIRSIQQFASLSILFIYNDVVSQGKGGVLISFYACSFSYYNNNDV